MRNNKHHLRAALLLPAALCLLFLSYSCASVPVHDAGPVTLAIFDIENITPDKSPFPDMNELISMEIIGVIGKRKDFKVVEREKLLNVLQELNMGSSELSSEATRLKVGRMLGARQMIFGGYIVAGDTIRLDMRRVDVESGKILKTSKETCKANDFEATLKAGRDAAVKLLQSE